MKPSTRIVVNTMAQYVRTIFNMILSLYSTRLVLDILGVADYGLYALVGSVVAMLSFVTNALVSATQRYVSFYQGKGVLSELKDVFNTSVVLHIMIGAFAIVLLECCVPFISDKFLNIPDGRLTAARVVYQQMIVMLFISFVASPYRALLVSHENIVYISAIDMLEAVLKTVAVLLLPYIPVDHLVMYGWMFLMLRVFAFLAYCIYDRVKYEECCRVRMRAVKFSLLKGMFGFVGWTIYSVGCVTARTQGLAVLINRFFGTAVNAAYGLGGQVQGFVSFISSSFATAINPQMVKSEGASDRKRMLYLAKVQSKIGFLLLAMISVPCIFEIDTLLSIWLKEVPQYATLFCIMTLVSATIDQLTMGLTEANRAIGDIKLFTLLVATPKLLVLPVAWLMLHFGMGIVSVVIVYIVIEFLTMLVRIPVLNKVSGLDMADFVHAVILKVIVPVVVAVMLCRLTVGLFSFKWRILLTFTISILAFVIVAYHASLEKEEQVLFKSLYSKLITKIRKS